jgi:hypothetical protein
MRETAKVHVGQVLAQRDGYKVVVTEVRPDGSYKFQGGIPVEKSK